MIAAIPDGVWLVGLGIGVLTALTMMQRAKMRRRGAGVDLARDDEKGKQAARDSMEALMVQLQEFSRETVARLDTKVRALGELIVRAEARIEELKKLTAAAPAAPAPAAAPAKAANPLHGKVFRLKDEGRAVADIASETGLERGEVELILGLREKGA